MFGPLTGLSWDLGAIEPTRLFCGWCSHRVSATQGSKAVSQSIISGVTHDQVIIAICPDCRHPTFILGFGGGQVPGHLPGRSVSDTPEDVAAVYDQARRVMTVGAWDAAGLLCRKLLMHVAVERESPEGTFQQYVEYLSEKYVPATARDWVDRIRTGGNHPAHEIVPLTKEEAQDLMQFTQMLLELVYELPAKVSKKP